MNIIMPVQGSVFCQRPAITQRKVPPTLPAPFSQNGLKTLYRPLSLSSFSCTESGMALPISLLRFLWLFLVMNLDCSALSSSMARMRSETGTR